MPFLAVGLSPQARGNPASSERWASARRVYPRKRGGTDACDRPLLAAGSIPASAGEP